MEMDNRYRVDATAIASSNPDTGEDIENALLEIQPENSTLTEIPRNCRSDVTTEYSSVDHGWAWVVLFGGFFISFFVVGGQKSFGILYVELSEKFHVSNKALSLTQSLAGFLQQFLGPISAALSRRYSYKTLICFGGLMAGGGLVLSSFATSYEVLYFTYGIITGIGYGMAFSPSVVMIADYFNKYRSTASGISLAGGGLGGMFFPYLIRYLLTEYGLHGALLVYGGIMWNICVCGLLIRPLKEYTSKSKSHEESTTRKLKITSIVNTICEKITKFTKQVLLTIKELEWNLFKQLNCILLFFAVFFGMFGYNSLFNIVPPFIHEIGLSTEDGAFVLFIFGLTDLIGRILFGYAMDVFPKHRHEMFATTILLFGSGIVCTSLLRRKLELCVLMGCYGLFAGGYNGTLMIMAVEYVDLERLPSTWGFICWSAAVAFLLNPLATGAIRDSTGTWTHAFQLSGAMSLTAVLILIFKFLKTAKESRSEELC
ncbi:Monocarboxylate transporter 12 [Mizuhopecten yessoensis]|uniref:Monocarboxylate transporter 12 n=2 Tax=Mizuhopecten yessoensis TaxID=6573 RepID=A0A210PXE9_MIZYE|nr:Monocarboxylate transporter 12 [Mizuhopecten yessoensis]